ncbi:MAG: hypothetical protein IJS61_06140 [Firmicutes bacterium]|nr:hypothetical protein [Bacillota bacterium]
MEVNTNIQSYQSENLPDLQTFVDEHIRGRTRYRSTAEFLNKSPFSLLVYVAIFTFLLPIIAVVLFVPSVIVLLFLFNEPLDDIMPYLICLIGAWFIWGFLNLIKKIITKKINSIMISRYSLKTHGNIDKKKLLYFLNTYLAPNKPYFHNWEIYSEPGVLESAVVGGLLFGGSGALKFGINSALQNSNNKRLQKIQYKSKFGDHFIKNIFLNIQLSGNENFPDEHVIFITSDDCYTVYKTAPIIQAIMQYYIQYFANSALTQNIDYENYVPQKERSTPMKKLIDAVILVIIILGLFIGIPYSIGLSSRLLSKQNAVDSVRVYWRLESLPDVTLETLLSSYFENLEWSKEKDGERTYVKLTGKTKGDGRDVSITFNPDDNPNLSLLVDTVVIDGQSFTQKQSDDFIGTLVQAYEDGVTDITNFGMAMYGFGAAIDDIPSILLNDVKNEDVYKAIIKHLTIVGKDDLAPMNQDSYNFIKEHEDMFPLLPDNYDSSNIDNYIVDVDFDDVYDQLESYDADVIVQETWAGTQTEVSIGAKTFTHLHTFTPGSDGSTVFYEIFYPGKLDNMEGGSVYFAGVPISKGVTQTQGGITCNTLYIAGCAIVAE